MQMDIPLSDRLAVAKNQRNVLDEALNGMPEHAKRAFLEPLQCMQPRVWQDEYIISEHQGQQKRMHDYHNYHQAKVEGRLSFDAHNPTPLLDSVLNHDEEGEFMPFLYTRREMGKEVLAATDRLCKGKRRKQYQRKLEDFGNADAKPFLTVKDKLQLQKEDRDRKQADLDAKRAAEAEALTKGGTNAQRRKLIAQRIREDNEKLVKRVAQIKVEKSADELNMLRIEKYRKLSPEEQHLLTWESIKRNGKQFDYKRKVTAQFKEEMRMMRKSAKEHASVEYIKNSKYYIPENGYERWYLETKDYLVKNEEFRDQVQGVIQSFANVYNTGAGILEIFTDMYDSITYQIDTRLASFLRNRYSMDVPQNTSGKRMANILLRRWGSRQMRKIERQLNIKIKRDFKHRHTRSSSVKWRTEEGSDSPKRNAPLQAVPSGKLKKAIRKVKAVEEFQSLDNWSPQAASDPEMKQMEP